MIVVLDTNVVVSALLNPFAYPGRVLDMVLARELRLAYDDRILAEYRQVLARPKFAFDVEDVDLVLDYLEATGKRTIARPLAKTLPDEDDLPFLEVAAEVGGLLVTGNLAHYPETARGEVVVLSPRQCLERWQLGRPI